MFGILCEWRKASKCKKLIKRALCRLKMLKKKRYSIARQLREDLFELISNGYQQIAFNRVEQLVRDESLMEAYDLIESFCEFILVKFSLVRKNKTCPDDLIEAISSLIFASARCGDFLALKLVRKFFEERYGPSFAMAAVELCPGNLVNSQIKEKLLMKPVSDHEKQRLISEIARDCFHPAILALEYCPDWHQKQVNGSGWIAAATFEDGSDSEFFPFCEVTIVYLDDVVELPDRLMEYGDLVDERFFMFKSPDTNMREIVRDGNNQTLIEKHDDSKRSTRRSMCRDRENHDLSQRCCLSCHSLSSEMENYCLEQPCYVHSECRTDGYVRSPTVNRLDHDSNEEINFDSHSRMKKMRNYEIGTVVYDVFVYPQCQPNENKETNTKPEEFSTKGQHESSLGFNGTQNSFKKCMKAGDKYPRPRHVHPKLPDYDEIAAKFIAMKREYLQRKQQQRQEPQRIHELV